MIYVTHGGSHDSVVFFPSLLTSSLAVNSLETLLCVKYVKYYCTVYLLCSPELPNVWSMVHYVLSHSPRMCCQLSIGRHLLNKRQQRVCFMRYHIQPGDPQPVYRCRVVLRCTFVF